jgi:hypothetical protein
MRTATKGHVTRQGAGIRRSTSSRKIRDVALETTGQAAQDLGLVVDDLQAAVGVDAHGVGKRIEGVGTETNVR